MTYTELKQLYFFTLTIIIFFINSQSLNFAFLIILLSINSKLVPLFIIHSKSVFFSNNFSQKFLYIGNQDMSFTIPSAHFIIIKVSFLGKSFHINISSLLFETNV
jgi:hypothetical protein